MRTFKKPLRRAIRELQGVSPLARALGIKRQLIQGWIRDTGRAPEKWCAAIEKVTGGKVTRHELRPDCFTESGTSIEAVDRARKRTRQLDSSKTPQSAPESLVVRVLSDTLS